MSWLAVRMERARRQKEAVQAIEEMGGHVTYDYESEDPYAAEPPVPKWARVLLGDDFFCDVVSVGMFLEDFGDDEATYFKGLASLKGGRLGFSQITDAGLENIEELADLEWLSLEIREFTDDGLKHLVGMTNLYGLHLSYTQITDAGLEHLEGLTNLVVLDLGSTQVTDAGLEHLKGLANLESLYLDDTQVTPEGVKKLQEALPECEIVY